MPCYDAESGYYCGPCPDGYEGDGTRYGCRPKRTGCETNPCFPGVQCQDTAEGFRYINNDSFTIKGDICTA